MILFYTTQFDGNYAFFEEEEARHCLQVLRKKEGDLLHFTDGKGGWYQGVITETGKRHFITEITDRQERLEERNFHLHIAIAPTKNMERIEWFLEKVTEIGIDEITPLQCEHSERLKIRTDRMQKILLAAMKQSLRAYLPHLHELTGFQAFVSKFAPGSANAGFIAHCQEGKLPHLKDCCPKGKKITILIGPEGDFSTGEIALAQKFGFEPVSLGQARLRTETAGLVSCHIVNLIHSETAGFDNPASQGGAA